jgi:hypothetical protein
VIQTIHTGLGAESCRREIDTTDPNETPYLVCPGVSGYSLIVRRVDSGRRSIDLVNPANDTLPLKCHEFITRHMFSLDPDARWRVATENGSPVPLALLVRVQARENNNEPDQVTQTYWAVAKLTANEACVTDRIPDGQMSETDIQHAADSARGRPCLPPQPELTSDGTVAR